MIGALNASVSGVKAFQQKLNVTANNVANMNTDEFKKQRAILIEGDNGGVRVKIDEIDTPGYPKDTVADGEVVESESSNVDLAEELTETIISQVGYDANLKMIQSLDDMLGALLKVAG